MNPGEIVMRVETFARRSKSLPKCPACYCEIEPESGVDVGNTPVAKARCDATPMMPVPLSQSYHFVSFHSTDPTTGSAAPVPRRSGLVPAGDAGFRIEYCPHADCGKPIRATVEKGVDTLIATDLKRLVK